MELFITRHASLVTSTLSGFDRIVFRGTLLPLIQDRGMFWFLTRNGVRLLDFGGFALKTSGSVKAAAVAEAQRRRGATGRSSTWSRAARARRTSRAGSSLTTRCTSPGSSACSRRSSRA